MQKLRAVLEEVAGNVEELLDLLRHGYGTAGCEEVLVQRIDGW